MCAFQNRQHGEQSKHCPFVRIYIQKGQGLDHYTIFTTLPDFDPVLWILPNDSENNERGSSDFFGEIRNGNRNHVEVILELDLALAESYDYLFNRNST